MSSCITGGGRAYRLDLEIIKSPSNSWTSNSSSPSSTLSESSNSPIAISTRKPRTPRKRPNQTYNEAAALLSTAYPKIFQTKHLTKPCKFTKQQQYPFSYETSSDLLQLPFQSIDNSSSFLIQQHQPKPISYPIPQKQANLLGEINSIGDSSELWDDFKEDFDAESILDEEIEEGIDSILGDVNVKKEEGLDNGFCSSSQIGTCYGYPVGLGFGVNFEFGFGMRNNNNNNNNNNRNIRAFRKVVDEGDWLSNQSVNIRDITPKFNKPQQSKKKKKNSRSSTRENLLPSMTRSHQDNTEHEKQVAKEEAAEEADAAVVKPSGALLLKLDYDNILEAWSNRGFPFSDDSPASDTAGNDVHARLAKLDLFSENGGIREASVLRYKEKRRSRLFSKKIRYQVRKVNADRRPRMKGRFVRRQNSPESEQG